MNFDDRKAAVKSVLVEPMSRQWAPPTLMANDPLAQQEALAGMIADVVENMPTDLNAEEARLLLGRVWKELRQTSRYRVWPANADVLAVLRDEVGRFRRDKPIAEAPKLPPRNNPHPDFCRKRAASFRAAGCEKIAATWDALADQSARNLAWWAAAREKGVK